MIEMIFCCIRHYAIESFTWLATMVAMLTTALMLWCHTGPEIRWILINSLCGLILADWILATTVAAKAGLLQPLKITNTIYKLLTYTGMMLLGSALDSFLCYMLGGDSIATIFILTVVCTREFASIFKTLNGQGIHIDWLNTLVNKLFINVQESTISSPKNGGCDYESGQSSRDPEDPEFQSDGE